MKITLISPYDSLNAYGLKSISTYLRRRGIAVSTIYLLNHFTTKYDKKIFDRVVKLCTDSDLIGISVMSNYLINSIQITEEIKKRLTIPIVWGGCIQPFLQKNA